MDMVQEQHKRVTGEPILSYTPEILVKYGLNQSVFTGSQCVLEKITQESNLNLPETPTSSDASFSPPATYS
jgi:hypothetical protein